MLADRVAQLAHGHAGIACGAFAGGTASCGYPCFPGRCGPLVLKEYPMKNKPVLEFSDVTRIAQAAQAEAVRNHWAVCIAIVDDGGHLLHLQRLDGAAATAATIASAKANTAALGRRESKVYEEMVNGGRVSFLSAPSLQGLLEGGVPIMVDGQCIGAVGVSGVKSSEDAQVAKAGIAALAL